MSGKKMKTFVHLHDPGKSNFENVYLDFVRLPIVGEYLTVISDGDWYKVEMVVHTPFSEEVNAELFAVRVNHLDEINKYVNN